MYELSSSDLRWIKKIDSEIWKQRSPGTKSKEEARKLSPYELLWLFRLIKSHRLPCGMVNTHFGFELGLVIYNHHELMIQCRCKEEYAGYECKVHNETLICITPDHLPYKRNPYGRMADPFNPKEDRKKNGAWNRVWNLFKRFTHSEINKGILKFYHLAENKSKGSYEY